MLRQIQRQQHRKATSQSAVCCHCSSINYVKKTRILGNTSNQRSKRAKRVTVSSSNNNTSYPTFHPDLPVLFTTSQMSDTVFQGSSDNIPSSLEPPLSLGSGWGGLFDSIDGTDS
ncbi:unnamed protein product [Rotaria socialis]|uniref:Uncharacterized protein n=1 Tax=Rotaria socialis TaxID=392032 RepID=A0A818ML42_9BILA|nr:unnamed protein product [Rotaria socialis]